MVKTIKEVKGVIQLLPECEGVYLWKDTNNEVIYVGKAKNLKKRINSYFQLSNKDDKTAQLVSKICELEYIITNSESEAFILESNLIKKYRPKYNILLKDDKKYPFIKITINEEFPRLFVTRDLVKDGSKYFGPYTDNIALMKTLRLIQWIFPLRTCTQRIANGMRHGSKPCINYQLGKCPAPCAGLISTVDYKKTVTNVIKFFSGKHSEVISVLKSEMLDASENQNYELAAKIRDNVIQIEKIQRKQTVFYPNQDNIDVIGCYKEDNYAVFVVLHVLDGRMLNQENYTLTNVEQTDVSETLTAFLKLYYSDQDELADKIIVPYPPAEYNELNTWLSHRIVCPQRGDKTKLQLMANKNAFHIAENEKLSFLRKTDRTIFPVKELKDKLSLPVLPRKIVCIDISTIQGEDTVSSAVFFSNGRPLKKMYRHFIIRDCIIQNDYVAIAETITRFFQEVEKNKDMQPDLIVIDGGKGQLKSALEVLKNNNCNTSLISIAKRVEEVFKPGHQNSIILPKSSSALRLLISIRDEAHRFALSLHRKRRTKRTLISELESIVGIGESTKYKLLREFGSVENLKNATLENLMEVRGIGQHMAAKIIEFFKNKN